MSPTSRPSVEAGTAGFAAARIIGFEPSKHLGDDAIAQLLADTLWEHGVLCVHLEDRLTDDEARALAAMIGPIKDPVARTRDGGTMRYSEDRQVIDSGFVLTDELRAELGDVSLGGLDARRPGLFEMFHTDDSYVERPAIATMLHARALPSGPGGDTWFLDMRAALSLLDPAARDRLLGLRAVYSYNNRGAFPPRAAAIGELEALEDVTHPIVRQHPVTGVPILYLDLDRATHVEGMPVSEGRRLLRSIQDHAEASAPRSAHAWQANDVVLWDNTAVQHRASGDFPVGEPRRFWRYMIEGPVPLAAESADQQ